MVPGHWQQQQQQQQQATGGAGKSRALSVEAIHLVISLQQLEGSSSE